MENALDSKIIFYIDGAIHCDMKRRTNGIYEMFDYGACVCSCGVFAYALNDKISKCLKYNSNVNKVNVIMEQWHLQKKLAHRMEIYTSVEWM